MIINLNIKYVKVYLKSIWTLTFSHMRLLIVIAIANLLFTHHFRPFIYIQVQCKLMLKAPIS